MKLKNRSYRILFMLVCLSALLTANSCTKSIDDLRKDPEAVAGATPSSFLSGSLYDVVTNLVTSGHTINNQLMQVSVLKQNDNEIHRYIINPGNFSGLWNYRPVANFNEMYDLAVKTNQPNYAAIALTLKAFTIASITDTYGDVPYSQALKGLEGNVTPAYDSQKSIYESLIASLDQANDLYLLNVPLAGEDLLFGANVASNMIKWKKFTNSLRLRLLMRIEKKGTNYGAMISAMLANPTKYPLMTSVTDGAALYYTGVTPYLNPFFGYRDTDFNDKLIYSSYFINYLKDVNDPRLPVWATSLPGGVYEGVQTGYPSSQQGTISGRAWSTFQIALKTNNKMGSMLQYAELEFLLAEACLKGYMADAAKTHYDKAIKASMDYWGVATVPANFTTNAKIAYNGTLEQIITQKYFALFGNGMEQWSEYRRTNFPTLTPGPEVSNNGKMPNRIPYPTVESLYNKESYTAAAAAIGGDNMNSKVWWQQ